MRSQQIHRALQHVPNRYALCQTISRSARMLHKTGSPIDGSLNTAFNVLNSGNAPVEAPAPAKSLSKDAGSLYRRMQYRT